jgi:hypothetical protein
MQLFISCLGTVPCNMKGTYKMLLWTTVYSPMIFYIYYNVMNRSHHVVFPAFQADVFMKVEPIKVHLVSYTYWYMIQGFVSDGLYRMVKSCEWAVLEILWYARKV